MHTKIFGLFITIFALTAASFAQGMVQFAMMDGSVRNTLEVDVAFTLPSDPGPVRIRMAPIRATSLEACMASTDFSAAVPMDPRSYNASYDSNTGIQHISFGVEREMKESGGDGGHRTEVPSCHVVRFSDDGDGDTDGRDFLIWQRNLGPSALIEERVETFGDSVAPSERSYERHIKMLVADNQSSSDSVAYSVTPASRSTGDMEKIATTYSDTEDRPVQVFEAVVPATSRTSCIANQDVTGFVPVPASRTTQAYGGGKKVVIAFVKTERSAACQVIIGRTTDGAEAFRIVRADYGSTSLTASRDEGDSSTAARARGSSTPVFKVVRRFPNQ